MHDVCVAKNKLTSDTSDFSCIKDFAKGQMSTFVSYFLFEKGRFGRQNIYIFARKTQDRRTLENSQNF